MNSGIGTMLEALMIWRLIRRQPMVRNVGVPRRRLAGARLASALVIVLALGAIRADGTLAAESYPDRGEGLGTRTTLREVFDMLDANHDDVVMRQEFLLNKTQVFYRFLKVVGLDQHLAPGDIKITPEAFAQADEDGDGKLSGAEFVEAPFSQFDAIDRNGDGEITFEEFREFMQHYQR
jgi:Ca2+-binding EF-hand superfamily protein